MLRFIYMVCFLAIYLLGTIPALMKVSRLEKKKQCQEKDQFVFSLAQSWAKTFIKQSGSKIQVKGEELLSPEGPVLFVSNHQSAFDIPILLGYINKPKGFIAKIETKKIPILGLWMKHLKCVFMDRNNVRQSLKAINMGVKHLKEGYSLVIFPEGTRSRDGKLMEFKPGSLKLALKSGVPIVPVTIKGSYKMYEGNGKRIRPAEVDVIISEPVYVQPEEQDAKQLAEHIQRIINDNLK